MCRNTHKALFILKGENYLRYFFIFILTGIIVLTPFSFHFLGFISIYLICVSVFGLICIRFPKLTVFENHFEIEKKCIIKKFSDYENYKYDNIRSVEVVKASINWYQLIVTPHRGYGGFSKPDQITITRKDATIKFIYRFGSRKQFEEAILIIQKKVKTINADL